MKTARSAYNLDANANSIASGVTVEDDGLVQQSEKDDADINTLVRRWAAVGQMPQGVHRPTIAEFDDVFDFSSAMEVIKRAEESFMMMPADVRKRFGNDPAEFMAFTSDDKNLEEMRKMGLLVAEEVKLELTPVATEGASGV